MSIHSIHNAIHSPEVRAKFCFRRGLRDLLSLTTAVTLSGAMLTSCFTGVESTPKIKASDLRKHLPSTATAEETFLADIGPQAVDKWTKGKLFYITNPKISIIFSNTTRAEDLAESQPLEFQHIKAAPSVTGRGASTIVFTTLSGDTLNYNLEIAPEDLLARDRLTVPFTIEGAVVDSVSARLKGHRFYISVPAWLPADMKFARGESIPARSSYIHGLRHVPVEITDVTPGNDAYPVCLTFKDLSGEFVDKTFRIYMTVGSDHIATRNFDTLFTFDNPRKKYPHITDKIWDLIIHSKVTAGMTRDECRLALGSPTEHSTRPYSHAMVERWSYDNGVYLIFEDGYLTRFRQ